MPFPLPTLAATVDAAGITAPTFADIYQSLQATFQGIYGSDGYIAPDSQDGQLLAAFAKAVSDCNATAIAVYNNYSPATSQGGGLSTAVKMNGLGRRVPTFSTVDVLVGGQAGTAINFGIVEDGAKVQWALPALVTIPPAGEIVVTATCAVPGAVHALPGAVAKIVTPTRGWQTVTNAAEASPGAPVETDAQLRRRQASASGLPAVSALGAIFSGLSELAGVTEVAVHENYTDATDAQGVPEHSVAVIIVGGDVDAIASTMALKKTPGCDTFGTTSIATADPNGLPIVISFSRPVPVPVTVVINLVAAAGYSADVTAAQQAAVAAFIEGLSIGETLHFNRLWAPALLVGSELSGSFQIISMTANAGTIDIPVDYNQNVTSASVTVNLV